MNILTLSLSKKYVQETANALGAVKGANATIESITPVEGGNNVVFAWTGDDGTKHTQTLFVANGKDCVNADNEGVASDDEIGEMLGDVFDDNSGSDTGGEIEGDTPPTDENLATDDEVNDALNDIFGN